MKLWNKVKSIFARYAARDTGITATDTEFTAEVVRLTQILVHPNAERLEIARFEMKGIGETTYEVVIGKGEFKVGDLAAYFSVDCIVPTAHSAFSFLKSRPDGANKEFFRLKAARLRGVFSQGLLVAAPAGSSFGDPMAETFGVTYHRAPEPGEGPTQPTKKPRPQPFPVYGVDSLKKLPRLFEEGETVYVTEKIHGTNFRFGWVRRRFIWIPLGWKFVVGSHRRICDDDRGGFYGEDLWREAAERMRLAERTRDYKGYTFYGELYGYTYGGQKIQDLAYDSEFSIQSAATVVGPRLRIFDVRSPSGEWLPMFLRNAAAADCGMDTVPQLYEGPYDSTIPFRLSEGKSAVAPRQIREGCVIESMTGLRRKAKYVGESYLMRKDA